MPDPLLNEEGEIETDPDLIAAAAALGEGGEEEVIPPYLRDLTEDDVYNRLNQVPEFQPQLTAMESRLNGGVNDVAARLSAYEKGLPTQAAFDGEKLIKGLEAYDPKLAEV